MNNRQRGPTHITVFKAIAIIVGSTVTLGLAGLGIGFALGKFAPAYYRSVFLAGRHPEFHPIAVGIGQGLTQGLILGIVTGLGLVGILCWYETRARKQEKDRS